MVYVLLGKGFEEIEAVTAVDILRRAKVDVNMVSLTTELFVQGSNGITVNADITLEQVDFESMEMLVLPGGLGGVSAIGDTSAAMDLIQRAWHADISVAAICAAPTLLARLDLIKGMSVVCYPTMSDVVTKAGANYQHDKLAIRDGKLTTGKSAGASAEFALELVAALRDKETAATIRNAIM